jgi:hypothetical protein
MHAERVLRRTERFSIVEMLGDAVEIADELDPR